jgi:hypothetical protein
MVQMHRGEAGTTPKSRHISGRENERRIGRVTMLSLDLFHLMFGRDSKRQSVYEIGLESHRDRELGTR